MKMRTRNNWKKTTTMVLSFSLIGGMLLSMPGTVYAANTNTTKEENVYATLNEDGSVQGIYVVNAYDLSSDTNVVDYGSYSSLKNLTNENKIEENGNEISVDASKGKFYYQGDLDTKNLPWNIEIHYYLDGKELKGEELAGKSGSLKIEMKLTQNEQIDASFFENYLLQATLLLPADQCTDIVADGATIANMSGDKQILFNVMGGQEKTLTVTADVTAFEMSAISFKGVPMSFDIDTDDMDTSKLTEKTAALSDGVSKVNEGAKSLASGVDSLSEGTTAYTDGVDKLASGASTLSSQTSELPKQMKQLSQAVENLNTGTAKLADTSSGAAAQITAALDDLESGLKQTKTGMITYAETLGKVQKEYQSEADTLGTIINSLSQTASTSSAAKASGAETTKQEGEKSKTTTGEPKTTTSSETQTGEYQKDRTETSQTESIGEDGTKTITITNQVYMTRENTTTITKETTTNTETTVTQKETVTTGTAKEVSTETLKSLGTLQNRMNANAKNLLALEMKITGNDGMTAGIDQLISGVEQLKQAVSGTGSNSLQSSLNALSGGTSTLNSSTSTLPSVSSKLVTGFGKLNTGLQTLNGNGGTLNGGVSALSSGAVSLCDGTKTLSDKTSNMDDQILDSIEEELQNFTGQDYDGISFVSTENTNIDAVQFAIQTQDIKVADEKPVEKVEKEETIWDKIKGLF